ncbi:UDP-N-acetylmuramyl pentapeptide phosphotransferase/UDP-N-acetylglucosamine-1-phosphate transferase [Nocardioides exalbidus]|uniref:UDP-N-acetylmuramyl pentapeptide phosphotransferase/UDP-N-acetylglucosamine-1-phosphate transferase n=1 Tax=Nocardioides exalbidus TaxID=402596 RepID=A0A1H4MRV7_9ACTN|nr:glycosyltransferase family 4 protein [Nocardioides exalbidus]SEB85683.1 UDP-N-acetylmuramyl pentapeptide phosphotransferase/UDP-N-acetylglucosamine-1-phosphate transferase [Nocardioides exalbidus]
MLQFFISFVVTSATMVPVLSLLRRLQVVDVPNQRSSHVVVVPRGGGLAMIAGCTAGVVSALIAGSALDDVVDGWAVLATCAGMLLLASLGFADDVAHVSARIRLALQGTIAAGVATAVAVGSPTPWPVALVAIFGCLWLVSYVNAFNFMDGVNAISATSALLAACWYGALGAQASDGLVSAAAWSLAGAALAFLPWNAHRPKVFLGDVGSYGIGALVGVLALLTAVREADLWLALAPLTVYLVDTSGTLLRRALRGEALMEAHRSHVYQRLLDVGLSHLGSTAIVATGGLVVCSATLALHTAGAILVAAVVAVIYHSLPSLLGRRVRVAS